MEDRKNRGRATDPLAIMGEGLDRSSGFAQQSSVHQLLARARDRMQLVRQGKGE
jgi:hypothetical protein